MSVLMVLGAIFVAVVGRVVSEDAKTLIPRFCRYVLQRASEKLDEGSQIDCYEEWLAHLDETPELTLKLWHSLSISLWGSGRIARVIGFSKDSRRTYIRNKRVFDIWLAVMITPGLFIILLPVCIMIKLDGGPLFFSTNVVGRNGKVFRCWRLRTMKVNSERILRKYLSDNPDARTEWDANLRLKADPRITAIGAFLRGKSIDELPEIWNVFKGEMSFVGPRPMRRFEEQMYSDAGSTYKLMKPGITGTRQRSGAGTVCYRDRERADAEYYKRLSFLEDLRIILSTAGSIISDEFRNFK
ncbi:sugar transferase [Puniceibacterium antarcticum]|uniref:sugar transferase n=1 Tax=Puniceibacterium antarcticum TaxID=1206336 RepID=UPI001FEA3327|nr:sugar transferase [Puniceibacterium antarcticum]